jgi:SNF2 family DNA or RNA helicase
MAEREAGNGARDGGGTVKTYGTIQYLKGKWRITPVAYVLTKLKRVFPRVSKRSHGHAIITDTPEICRELEWFLTRYPMDWVRETDQDHLRSGASRHRASEETFELVLSGERDPRTFNTRLPLRRYQQIGADLCLSTGGLLVADEVGLGKTALAIGVLCDPRTRPALVVTLAHLPRQWEAEVRKFNPSLRTHILRSGTPYDLRIPVHRRVNGQQMPLLNDGQPDVLISTYHKLAGWAEALAGKVHSVIFDEVQELRRGDKSHKGAAAYHIADAADYRVGLSGTPIYNYGGEFHNVMRALRPGSLGSWNEFCEEWCGGYVNRNGQSSIKDPKGFGAYLRDQHLMIRRTRSEVGRELPSLQTVAHYVDCDADTIARIETSATELARVIMAAHGDTERGEKMRASEELSNLVRQATGVAKAPYVAEFAKLLLEQGEPVVLYGWHREVYEIWLSRLAAYKPVMYTGSESAVAKDRAKDAFLKGETNLLVMSLRSGAGLDGLQARCRTVVFGELDWSPGVHEQCSGRVHRDGQTDPVVAYYLIAEDGSDPVVADVLGVKRGQIEGVTDPDKELVERLDVGADHVRKLAERYLRRSAA